MIEQKNNFTIVELLVAIVIVIIIGTTLYKFQSNTAKNFRQGQWREEMNTKGNMLFELLKQDIKSMMNINEKELIATSNWTEKIKELSNEFPLSSKDKYIFKIPYSNGDKIEIKDVVYEYDRSAGKLIRRFGSEKYILGEHDYEFIVKDFKLTFYGKGPYFIRADLKLLKKSNNVDTTSSIELTTSLGVRFLNSAVYDPAWKPVSQNLNNIKY